MIKYFIDYRNKKHIRSLSEMITKQIEELELTLEETEKVRNIDEAYGKSLDYYGDRLGIKRAGYNDETYRLVLKGFLLALYSSGTLDDIAKILTSLLNAEYEDISIQELYEDFGEKSFVFSELLEEGSAIGFADLAMEEGGMLEHLSEDRQSATIKITKLPLERLLELGILVEDLMMIIKQTVPAGVRLESVELDGTFELGSELEVNSEVGFDRGILGQVYGRD